MAALSSLQFLTVAAKAKHTATVIFVHGLGDSGLGWKPVAEMFGGDAALSHVKWVLPHAPVKPVTANGGYRMPSWFDIQSFDNFDPAEDEKGMLETVHSLNQLITAEVDVGIPADRIVLGGFSQGGAMSLLTGLTTERRLGGVAVLSGWLPLKAKFRAMMSEHAKQLPIFWGHGADDPLVRYAWAQRSVDYMKSELGIKIADENAEKPVGLIFKTYPDLEHSTDIQELRDFNAWLRKVIPEKAS